MPQAVSPRTRTRLPKEVRRRNILEAAVDVFGRSGYRDGSLQEIADQAGMTVPGLLHYFPSKVDLLLATLMERERAQREAFAADGGRSTFALGRAVLRRNLEQPGIMRLRMTLTAEATAPDHPAHPHMSQRYRETTETFTASLREDVTAGRIGPSVSAPAIAPALIAVMDGLQMQYLLDEHFDLLAAYEAGTVGLLQMTAAQLEACRAR